MSFKKFAVIGLLSLVFVGIAHTSAEARRHRHGGFGMSFGATEVVQPVYQDRVVEYYYPGYSDHVVVGSRPYYGAPVYGAPAVLYPAPVAVREVYVAPRVVAPVRQAGFSWFFGW